MVINMSEVKKAIEKAIEVQKELSLNGLQEEAVEMQAVIDRLKSLDCYINFINSI